ncbi:MAG: LysM-like peptidoglycan-binding domain-containing protein, partial [Succinivibrio dextrinosolvens]|nr:LysM-like peptidoglycan-binding domain-containing protein [Succinivibrio dextrinosolvens]
MINVKITNRTAAEDFIAVEKETGATTLPGKHIFAIFSVGIISVLLALPFGSIIPESASPFTALSTGREEQNRVYEQEYLKNNEVIAEANVEISSTAGSEENYDDDINTEALIAQASQAEIKKEREAAQAAATAEPEQRGKFVATDIEKNSSEKILADKKTQSEKYISSILAPNRIPGTIARSETEKVFNGKWYEQTIRKGDSLSKIFSYLNLNNDDLKKITAVARDSDLNLSVGQKIQFLIAEDNSVQEIAIPLSGNKQVRFSRDIEKNTYTVARERRFAQFSDLKSRGMDSATLMPSFIEAEKERNKKRLEQEALLSQKQKEDLEKARLKREQLAAQKKQDALLAAAEREKSKSIYKGKTRPRLIIGSIGEKESFDKAAARYGLTRSEIVTIKNQYVGRINFNKLSAGDSFRILFNGIGQGSSMTAISMNTKMFGQINLYRHQLNHIFYEENGYNPSTGAFRRFPIMGQIKVSSPFNLRRFHPI